MLFFFFFFSFVCQQEMEMICNLISVQAAGLTYMDTLIWVIELMRLWLSVQQGLSMGPIGFQYVQNYISFFDLF